MDVTHIVIEKTYKPIVLVLKSNLSAGVDEWRCIRCGKLFLRTKNKSIVSIFEGEAKEITEYISLKCWNCPTIYIL